MSKHVGITLKGEDFRQFIPLFEREKEHTIGCKVYTKEHGVGQISGFISMMNKTVAKVLLVPSFEHRMYSLDTFFSKDIEALTLNDKCHTLFSKSQPEWYRTEVKNRTKTVFEPSGEQRQISRTALSKEHASLLDKCKVNYLFHITHIANLPDIFEHGLLSHNLAYRNAEPIDISDPEVNERRTIAEPLYGKSLHDYVPLYFNPKTPMLSKLRDKDCELAIIVLDRTLILDDAVVFTDGNAAADGTGFTSKISDLSAIDWEFMWSEYWNNYNDGKRRKCAEVLIPTQIPPDRIELVTVKDYDSFLRVDASVTAKVQFQIWKQPFTWE